MRFTAFSLRTEFDIETGQPTEYSVKPDDYGDFLCRLFDRWYNNGDLIVSIGTFDNIAIIYAGIRSVACIYMKECGNYAVIEYNGDVYPCDFFVEENLKLGNIMETPLKEIVSGQKMQAFSKLKCNDSYEKCLSCEWEHICHCGCQHYRYQGGMDYLCESYRQLFAYADSRLKILGEKIKRQHAMEMEQRLIQQEKEAIITKTINRNDPCPCGSGKKYKKCCMVK
jgi:uncharacterized protein